MQIVDKDTFERVQHQLLIKTVLLLCYNKSRKRCVLTINYYGTFSGWYCWGYCKHLFSRQKDSPNEAVFDLYYNSKLKACQASLRNAQKVYRQVSSELATIKSLSGSGWFALNILNKLIAQKAEEISNAANEIEFYKSSIDNDLKILGYVKAKFMELLSWADMFNGILNSLGLNILGCSNCTK